MKTTMNDKRVMIGLILAVTIALVLTPIVSFGSTPDQLGSYVSVDDEGNIIDGTSSSDAVTKTESKNGVYVEQSKTIEPTDEEDVFKINLKVQTNEVREEVVEAIPQAYDVVIILDTSNSMYLDYIGSNTRWNVAKDNLTTFINSFLAGDGAVPGNRVAIGVFSGWSADFGADNKWDDHNSGVCGWTSDPATAISTYKDVDNPRDLDKDDVGGGTNMQAGFMAAEEMLSKSSPDNEKVVIYVSDGEATFYYDDDGYTLGRGSVVDPAAEAAAIAQLESLKNNNPGMSLYTLGIAEGLENNAVLRHNIGQANGVDKFFYALTSDTIKESFTEIKNTIVHSVKAWNIQDPMSKWVKFIGFDSKAGGNTNADGTAKFENGRIDWNLEESNAKESNGMYTYEQSYYVKLDKSVEGFESGVFYPTNQKTTLNYAFYTDNISEGMKSSDFLIPTVNGVAEKNPDDGVLGDEENPGDDGNVLGQTSSPEGQKVLGEEAKTGDLVNTIPYLLIMVVAAAVVLTVVLYKANKKKS